MAWATVSLGALIGNQPLGNGFVSYGGGVVISPRVEKLLAIVFPGAPGG